MSNQGYDPILLKSVFAPNPLIAALTLSILKETTVLSVVVITASDIPPKAPNPAASLGWYAAASLPIYDAEVSLYQQKAGLEPLFDVVNVGTCAISL